MAAVPSIGRATGVEFPEAASAEAAHGLYDRHYARVLGFCRNRLRTREEAEDAAQTTFCYALGALRRGVVPASETAWLLKIARNVCLNRWAANRRRNLVEVARDPQVLQEVASGRDGADSERLALQDALEQLTELQRRAIVLREWQGLSYGEIAHELGLSRAAVETLIFRARRSLARHLRGDRRLHSGLDLGSILTGLKSLLTGGGAAIKTVVAVAALATAGAIAEPRLQHELRHARSSPASSQRASEPASSPALRQSRVPAAGRAPATPAPVARVAPVTGESPRRAGSPAEGPSPANAEPTSPGSSGPAAPALPAAPAVPATPGGTPSPAAPTPVAPPAVPEIPSTGSTTPALPSAPSAPALPAAPALPPVPSVPTVPVPAPVVPTMPTPPVSAPSAPALP